MDPALTGAALRTDALGFLRDGGLLGRLLDTFVAAQLRPEIAASARSPRLHHLRDKNGRHEVDLLTEMADRVTALPVSARWNP